MNLPHGFPFRWIDRAADGSARVLITANCTWLRGDSFVPTAFLAELVAQAAAVLLAGPGEGAEAPGGSAAQRWLAGIDRLELHRPARAGDLLEVSVVAGRRFGNAMQVEGVVSTEGTLVAEVVLLLV